MKKFFFFLFLLMLVGVITYADQNPPGGMEKICTAIVDCDECGSSAMFFDAQQLSVTHVVWFFVVAAPDQPPQYVEKYAGSMSIYSDNNDLFFEQERLKIVNYCLPQPAAPYVTDLFGINRSSGGMPY